MHETKERQPVTAKKVVGICLNGIAWIIVAIALLMTVLVFTSQSANGVSSLLGKMPMTVQTDSMKPTMNAGDLIIDSEISDPNTLKVGDIITFWTIIDNKKAINTHKIITVQDQGGLKTFVTKGDNNPAEDTLSVYPADIIGKYTGIRLPGFGNVLDFLKTSTGFLFCIVLPLVIFFLYELYRFITVIVSMKKTKITEEEKEKMKQKIIDEYIATQNGDQE